MDRIPSLSRPKISDEFTLQQQQNQQQHQHQHQHQNSYQQQQLLYQQQTRQGQENPYHLHYNDQTNQQSRQLIQKRVPLKDSSKFFVNSSTNIFNTNEPFNENAGQIPLAKRNSLLDQRADTIAKHQQLQQSNNQNQSGYAYNNHSMQDMRDTMKEKREKERVKHVQNRMTGAELKNWQAQWRKIMKGSVVYFEHDDKNEKDKLRAKQALASLGVTFERFFGDNVTIIISKRHYDKTAEYPKGDIFRIARKNMLKVWNYEKVFKFMNDLGEPMPEIEESSTLKSYQLSSLLKNEKLFGPNDRDPNARRDDIKYFTAYYLYIYDLKQQVRPIAIREWNFKNDPYPKLHRSTNGRSLFIEDQTSSCPDKKHKRRIAFLEETRDYRMKLIEATPHPILGVPSYEERVGLRHAWEIAHYGKPLTKRQKVASLSVLSHDPQNMENENSPAIEDVSMDQTAKNDDEKSLQIDAVNKAVNRVESATNTAIVELDNQTYGDNEAHQGKKLSDITNVVNGNKRRPSTVLARPHLLRNDSVLGTNQSMNKYNNEFGEIEASGVVQQQSNSSIFQGGAANQLGNGLGPTTSNVFNKKVANDKKKMITFTPVSIPKPTSGFFGGAPQSPTAVREAISVNRRKEALKVVQVRRDHKFVRVPDVKRDTFISSEEAAMALIETEPSKNEPPATFADQSATSAALTTPTKKRKNKRKMIKPKRESLEDIIIPPVPTSKKSRNQCKPGYCENCRMRYDDFDDHILCDRHRHFATNSENFDLIDRLIDDVNIARMMSL